MPTPSDDANAAKYEARFRSALDDAENAEHANRSGAVLMTDLPCAKGFKHQSGILMPTLTRGQSVTLQMSEGESWTVTPTGQAQISTRGVSGGPLQAPTTIATATTFGPYAESGTLDHLCNDWLRDLHGSELSALVSAMGWEYQ